LDDILIRGARVIDGSGAPGRVAGVAVRDGRIVAVSQRHEGLTRRVIEPRAWR
jgi:N-acyl-D-aspartate/D-glutamate deacylase